MRFSVAPEEGKSCLTEILGIKFILFRRLLINIKADFQSVLRTLESLFTTFVLFHVRRHEMK